MPDTKTTSLKNFITLVQQVNFARPNTFLVEINLAPFLTKEVNYKSKSYTQFVKSANQVSGIGFAGATDDTFGDKNKKAVKLSYLTLLCHSAELPGVNIITSQIKNGDDYREVAYGRNFGPIQLSFLIDSTMRIKEFWDDWNNFIHDKTYASWPDDYKTDITITQLEKRTDIRDKSNEPQEMYSVKLFKCYPKSVNPMNLNHDDMGIHQLIVTIDYTNWESL